jgi:hypothetical protein
MECECDLDSMQTTERGNEEHEMKLDRARASPLGISTLLPPEILGNIFHWTMIFQRSYGTSPQAPSNLLLVCRHWFEVGLQTPQLWTSWGDSMPDWKRRYTSPAVSGLHLKLNINYGYHPEYLSKPLLDALQDRAARDFIRRVSFRDQEAKVLSVIIPAITTQGEGVQPISLESFELYSERDCYTTVKLSDFFARYRFPKLQRLLLNGRYELLSWDLLASRTGALVSLELDVRGRRPVPTVSQSLSILSSNPNLQHIELHHEMPTSSDSDQSSLLVELPHLKWIKLSGNSREIFEMLNRLRPADKLDLLDLELSLDSTLDITQTFARFLWHHLQRRGDLQDGLAVVGDSCRTIYYLWVGYVVALDNCRPSEETKQLMNVRVSMDWGKGPQDEVECANLFFESIVYIHDRIVYLTSDHSPLTSAKVSVGMINLVEIKIRGAVYLSGWFAEPDLGGTYSYGQLLPSLKYLSILEPRLDRGDWTPLTTFLSRRASVGNRLESLEIGPYRPHMCSNVAEEMKKLVGHFECHPRPSSCRHCKYPGT